MLINVSCLTAKPYMDIEDLRDTEGVMILSVPGDLGSDEEIAELMQKMLELNIS